MAELPDALFEQLPGQGVLSSRALANVALAYKIGDLAEEVEHCPYCGGVIRICERVGKAALAATRTWLDGDEP